MNCTSVRQELLVRDKCNAYPGIAPTKEHLSTKALNQMIERQQQNSTSWNTKVLKYMPLIKATCQLCLSLNGCPNAILQLCALSSRIKMKRYM